MEINMTHLTQLLSDIVIGFVIFDYLSRMYGNIYHRKIIYGASYFAFVLVYFIINHFNNPFLNMTYGFVMTNLLGYLLYKKHSHKIVYNIFFLLYLFFIDFITIPIFSLLNTTTLLDALNKPLLMFTTGMAGLFIVLATYRLVIERFKNNAMDSVSRHQTIFLLCLSIFEICTVIGSVFIIDDLRAKPFVIFLIVGYTGIDIYTIYLFEFVARHNDLRHQYMLSQQQSVMILRYYQEINDKYERSRRLLHDMKIHVNMIEQLYDMKDGETGQKYAAQIYQDIKDLGFRFNCTNRFLKILVNDILMTADSKGIPVNLSVQDVLFEDMDNKDMTTLFGNLFTNALEACEEVGKGAEISFRMHQRNENAVIVLSNPYKKVIESVDQTFLSTKTGHSGIGLSNVESITRKYGGTMTVKIEKSQFIVKVLIPQKSGQFINSGRTNRVPVHAR